VEAQRAYRIRERPLSPEDYDVPLGWWGWNWEPPVPMSIAEIVAARNFDARAAAVCWLALEGHGSLLIAAEPPHSGKTTTLTALLDLVPHDVRRVFLRGWAETFDFMGQTEPRRTLLLANELSSHLPVYLWGPKAVETFRTLRRGYALASTLHADNADEAVAQLTGELGVDPADLARVDLLLVMRMFRLGGAYAGAGSPGPVEAIARRVVSMHRLVPGPLMAAGASGGVRLLPLATFDPERDALDHDETAELDLLCSRRGGPLDALRAELDRRERWLGSLVQRGLTAIPAVRQALAELRGEAWPRMLRGDPA